MALGDVQTPQGPLKIEDLDINGPLENSSTIAWETLLDIARGNLQRYLTHGHDGDAPYLQRVRSLWWRLLATMQDSSVVDGHMNASCNAICVFIKTASSSPVLSVKAFAMSAEIWMAVFDTLLHKFSSGKLKPLRQVLNAFLKTLGQHDDRIRARSIQNNVLSRVACIVLVGKPVSYYKASMVIFEAFIRSGVPMSRVLAAIGRGHGSHSGQFNNGLIRRGIDVDRLRATMNLYAIDESVWNFSFSVILAVADSNAQATAGKFFTSFMSILESYGIPSRPLWIELLVTTLHRYPNAIEAFRNYLLPSILKLHSKECLRLLHRMASNGPESSTLRSALTVSILGLNAGLLSERDIATCLHMILQGGREPPRQRLDRNLDDATLYDAILTHSSAAVRIKAYELIFTSAETTTPIRSCALQLLLKNLAYLHGDTEPGNRGEISGITKVMVHRLERSSVFRAKCLAKPDLTDIQCTEHKNELKQHQYFIERFISFLEDELGPNCSYPRHISALRALELLLETAFESSDPPKLITEANQVPPSWPAKGFLHCQSMIPELWNLALNPFEEVRATSGLLLRLLYENAELPAQTYFYNTVDDRRLRSLAQNTTKPLSLEAQRTKIHLYEISCLVRDINAMAALTNRADHADGLGRLLGLQYHLAPRRLAVVGGLLERLERVIGCPDREIALAAIDFSVHGYLMGLKYIIENPRFYKPSNSAGFDKENDVILHRLLKLCNDVWHTVRNDLCADSPELSREADAIGPCHGPKDFLSYSWRMLRDSNLVMQAVLVNFSLQTNDALPGNGRIEHLRAIHALCFVQLTQLRHRGAFSAVAQTFALCCEQFVNAPTARADLEGWYQDAFQILEDQSATLTRRSAGLPAILACLLIPSTSKEFNGVIGTLATLAKSERAFPTSMTNDEETRLPEVHALNCLREIFTNSRFKVRTLSWLTEVLELASSSLSSGIWAIRNCGLMLFRACASRIGTADGLNDSETGELALAETSEAMLGIALKLLNSGQHIEVDSPELVFAGLDLISRVIVPAKLKVQTKQQILLHLSSPIWMIREHAARLYASQVSEAEALGAAIHLISSMTLSDQNRCHGVLLCSRQLVEKHMNASLPFAAGKLLALERALRHHEPSIQQYAAPAVHCAFLDIVNDCIAVHGRSTNQSLPWFLQPHWNQKSRTLGRGEPKFNLETPSGSQLLSSLALNSCLIALAGTHEIVQTLYETFQDVALYDLDAAAALLYVLRNHAFDQRNLRQQVEFYIRIIQEECDENILVAAIFGLSLSLEHTQESRELPITRHELGNLLEIFTALPFIGGRDLFNARIRGLGSVLNRTFWEVRPPESQYPPTPFRLWITMLSSAAKDTTEVLTRLNAARSLHYFGRCLMQECGQIAAKDQIILFSVLYDFLNDDDEEVRDLAASTVSLIIKPALGRVDSQLCPLAACHLFSDYMAQTFASNADFHLLALRRVMFPISIGVDVPNDFAALASCHSVRKQLDLACEESYDLFEEERQNLYLDEVREINIWSLVLGKILPEWLDDDVRLAVGDWTLRGLIELTAALPRLTSGPFGVLGKLEMLILFMRVIRMAEWSLQRDYSSELGVGPPRKSTYLVEMARLLSAAREYPIHRQAWKALEDGVQRGQAGHDQLQKRWAASLVA